MNSKFIEQLSLAGKAHLIVSQEEAFQDFNKEAGAVLDTLKTINEPPRNNSLFKSLGLSITKESQFQPNTDAFKQLLDWRHDRRQIEAQKQDQNRQDLQFIQAQKQHQLQKQIEEQEARRQAKIREEMKLVRIYSDQINSIGTELDEALTKNKERNAFYTYYQQKVDRKMEALQGQLTRLNQEREKVDAANREIDAKEDRLRELKQLILRKPSGQAPHGQWSETKAGSRLEANPYSDQQSVAKQGQPKGLSRRVSQGSRAPPSGLPGIPAQTSLSSLPNLPDYSTPIKTPMKQVSFSLTRQEEDEMLYRKLLTQPAATMDQQNPFKNQRARNKWNEFMAKETAMASPGKTKRGSPFKSLQKMDTYDQIYGGGDGANFYRQQSTKNFNDDLNDRSAASTSPTASPLKSILSKKTTRRRL